MKNPGALFIIMTVFLFFPSGSYAATGQLNYEWQLIGGYSDNDQWIGKRTESIKNAIGLEYYKKFSNEYGDTHAMDIQMRFSYDSLDSSNEAWALEIHNAWLDYKLGLGQKVRLGHFDPLFGLEPTLDTHATLFQSLASKNIGFKKDWGISYSGFLGEYDYGIAAQLGSGMSVRSREGSHLLTGRISSPTREDFHYGLSLLYGKVLESDEKQTFPVAELTSDEAILKKRIGLDAQYLMSSHVFKGEVAYGSDEDKNVLGLLTQWDYLVPSIQNLEFQVQAQSWSRDVSESNLWDTMLGAGLSFKINSELTLRTAYFQDLEVSQGEKDKQFIVQLYYFGF